MTEKKDVKAGRVVCNMKKFLEVFNEQYEYLYDNPEEEKSEEVEKFDKLSGNNSVFRCLVRLVINAREDFISSDREAAAFVRTVDILGAKIH